MGILNITPDSFYAKSRIHDVDSAVKKGLKMLEDGATIIDIGGYSSRPGASAISTSEEIARVIPIITALKEASPDCLISIDTFRSSVAASALEAGASIINDISGGLIDSEIHSVAAAFQSPYILMHMRGTPQTMMNDLQYENIISEIFHFFSKQINKAKQAGVKDIILDPGFGFSKNLDQNYALLAKMDHFKHLGHPLLIGISRKSMIYKALGISAEESLNGTTVLNTISLSKGAQILRVHDVKEAVEAITLVNLLNEEGLD